MRTTLLIAAIAVAAAPLRAQQHFSASELQGVGIHRPGKIVITITGARVLPMPAYLSQLITTAAEKHGVDARLVAAVARRESAGNPQAISRTGACGIMQLMPNTARALGVTDVFDPEQNVNGGVRYLRRLLDQFNGDLDLTLAAYNAGPAAVQRYGGVPPFAETRAYVKAVRQAYEER